MEDKQIEMVKYSSYWNVLILLEMNDKNADFLIKNPLFKERNDLLSDYLQQIIALFNQSKPLRIF